VLLAITERLLGLVPTLLGMTLVMFLIANMLPGDPARAAAGGADATVEMVEAARRQYGLDKPLLHRYGHYLLRLAQGDLGASFVTRRPIAEDLRQYYPATIELAVASILVTSTVGVPLGIWLGVTRRRALQVVGEFVSLIGTSVPAFWLGLLLVLIFYGVLAWLPAGGRLDETIPSPPRLTGALTIDGLLAGRPDLLADALHHLVLPVIVQSIVLIGYVIRITRDTVEQLAAADFVRTARAKGLAEPVVLFKHVLKLASVSILTMIGLLFGMTLSGAIVIETVFAWPGVGRYAAEAIENKDLPAIMGFATTFSILYALVNLLTDLLCAMLRPRGA
jgi:peptide/nickel transport system permease protein